MRAFILTILFALYFGAAIAQDTAPTPTFSDDVLSTQAAYEAAVDALPLISTQSGTLVNDATAVPESTEEAPVAVIINIDNAAPADVPVEPVEPAPASIPADTVHVALVVGGIIALAIIGVAAFLLKTTGEQLYTSLPPIAQYGLRASGEYLLSRAAQTPETDDDAAIESALRALGFVVVREEDGSITLRRPTPVTQGPMPPLNTAIAAQAAVAPQTTVTFTGAAMIEADVRRIVAEQYALGTPLSAPPQQPSDEAVAAFTGDAG